MLEKMYSLFSCISLDFPYCVPMFRAHFGGGYAAAPWAWDKIWSDTVVERTGAGR
jgi:hypothetical protein